MIIVSVSLKPGSLIGHWKDKGGLTNAMQKRSNSLSPSFALSLFLYYCQEINPGVALLAGSQDSLDILFRKA
jgi:hypothetical protein